MLNLRQKPSDVSEFSADFQKLLADETCSNPTCSHVVGAAPVCAKCGTLQLFGHAITRIAVLEKRVKELEVALAKKTRK